MASPHPTTSDLLAFIGASPTPHHCVAEVLRRLTDVGFVELDERQRWQLEPEKGYVVPRGGGVVAFRVGKQAPHTAGFRLIGAHTDSPNLRVKPNPDTGSETYHQLGVEVYGGALTYTWLDRDLGLAGLVVVRDPGPEHGVRRHLVRIDEPILRIPSLAIHLDREVRSKGLHLNDQKHLVPILSLGTKASSKKGAPKDGPGPLRALLGEHLNVDPELVLSWDLSLFDVVPPNLGGHGGELVFSPRLDNQAMCHAALLALQRTPAAAATQVICLYDHEEVGSGSVAGAAGSLAEDVLHRIAELEGPGAVHGSLALAVAHSFHVSADMAHAVHPNYADLHEPAHHPVLNGGPVIKFNAQQRYATSAESAARFEAACRDLSVPCQKFVTRTDMPCGSTIGPIAAARLGIATVDVGNPMLSMHSIRELAGASDPESMTKVMAHILAT